MCARRLAERSWRNIWPLLFQLIRRGGCCWWCSGSRLLAHRRAASHMGVVRPIPPRDLKRTSVLYGFRPFEMTMRTRTSCVSCLCSRCPPRQSDPKTSAPPPPESRRRAALAEPARLACSPSHGSVGDGLVAPFYLYDRRAKPHMQAARGGRGVARECPSVSASDSK